MNLLTDFIGKKYTVYVDNYYSFVQLTQQLSSNKIYICRTLRSDHKDNPKDATKKKFQKCKMIWRELEQCQYVNGKIAEIF